MEKKKYQSNAIAIKDNTNMQLATNYVTSHKYLGSSNITPIANLYEVGFENTHMDMLLETIDYDSPMKNSKINNLLTAIRNHHSDKELEIISSNYDKFTEFLDYVTEIEILRHDLDNCSKFKPSYSKCFKNTKQLSVSEFQRTYESIDRTNMPHLDAIVENSINDGIFPETFLELGFKPRYYK